MTVYARTFIVLCGACLLVSLPGVMAQGPAPSPPPKRHYEYRGFIKSIYDPASDHTIVALQPYRIDEGTNVYQPGQRVTHIMVGFNFAGRKLTAQPAAIEFIIIAETVREVRFQKGKLELTAVTDGEVISLGKLTFKKASDGPRVYARGVGDIVCGVCKVFHEERMAHFTYEGLLRIASARKIELQAGSMKLKVDKDLREALRDLASRATP